MKTIRHSFCSSCPKRNLERDFKSSTEKELDKKLKKKWKKYGFDYLVQTVLKVLSLEDSDKSKWTLKTARLVGIVQAERNRRQRAKDWVEERARQRNLKK